MVFPLISPSPFTHIGVKLRVKDKTRVAKQSLQVRSGRTVASFFTRYFSYLWTRPRVYIHTPTPHVGMSTWMHLPNRVLFVMCLLFQLTWADLYFAAVVDLFSSFVKMNILEGYTCLQDLKDKVLAIPQIKSWVETRPDTDM